MLERKKFDKILLIGRGGSAKGMVGGLFALDAHLGSVFQ